MKPESQANGVPAWDGLLDLDRGPSICGTRITIYTVLEYLIHGRSREYIAELLNVSVEQVQAAITYIAEHDLEVLREYVKILERIRRGNAPEVEAKLAANRPRVQELLRLVREAKERGESDEQVRELVHHYRTRTTQGGVNGGNHGR